MNKLVEKKVDGELISPVLPDDIKNYLIDIDGTICDDIPNEEPERMATAALYPDALETLNKWYEQGHYITFFTSRVEEHRGLGNPANPGLSDLFITTTFLALSTFR
ncbi:MAG: hypothetical protein P8L19_03310, partial [Flavobacteriales bacterium]|nr:hypothetical protein [Flavobacteriales bacterium]